MKIIWRQPLPKWASALCAMFGLVIIVNTVAMMSEESISGALIGAVWFGFGIKGFPLFTSAPDTGSDNERIEEGLRRIRRRRLVSYLAIIPFMLFMVMVDIPKKIVPTVFTLGCLTYGAFMFFWAFSLCPRCNESFYGVLKFRLTTVWSRCASCELPINGSRNEDVA